MFLSCWKILMAKTNLKAVMKVFIWLWYAMDMDIGKFWKSTEHDVTKKIPGENRTQYYFVYHINILTATIDYKSVQ